MICLTKWEIHDAVFLTYDVKTSKSGKYILASCDVLVVGNSQDAVIVRAQIHPLPEN